ncbi:MAG: hypothetical protein HKP27_06270 [Myxococcales bacterium]|nr:hypothetical protein [Myxococcales bacterium]
MDAIEPRPDLDRDRYLDPPLTTTLLNLVATVSEIATSDAEVTAVVTDLLEGCHVRLVGVTTEHDLLNEAAESDGSPESC